MYVSLLRNRWDVTQCYPQRNFRSIFDFRANLAVGDLLGERCVTSQKTAAKETICSSAGAHFLECYANVSVFSREIKETPQISQF